MYRRNATSELTRANSWRKVSQTLNYEVSCLYSGFKGKRCPRNRPFFLLFDAQPFKKPEAIFFYSFYCVALIFLIFFSVNLLFFFFNLLSFSTKGLRSLAVLGCTYEGSQNSSPSDHCLSTGLSSLATEIPARREECQQVSVGL